MSNSDAVSNGDTPPPAGAAVRAGCHDLLLRLAGRVPDGLIAAARVDLAEPGFEPARLAARLALALAEDEVPVTGADLDLLARLLTDGGADSMLLSGVPVQDGDAAPPHLFAPAPMALLEQAGDRITPCLDLTFGPDSLISTEIADAVDDAAVAAVAGIQGAVGLWRAWRFPSDLRSADLDPAACRVLLLEVAPGEERGEARDEQGERVGGGYEGGGGESAQPWTAAAALQRVLAAHGDPAPQVEVFATGDPLPIYHATARAYAALLWAAAPGVPIRIAKIFDHDTADGLGTFDPGHATLPEGGQRDRLLALLDDGVVLAATDALLEDVVDPLRDSCVPLTVRTDGVWIWTDTVSYYLREHGLSPDPELAAYLHAADGPPQALDGVALFRALRRLQHEGPS